MAATMYANNFEALPKHAGQRARAGRTRQGREAGHGTSSDVGADLEAGTLGRNVVAERVC